MLAGSQAPVAVAAITQDRALIGLLRSVVDSSHDLILVSSEAELTPHLNRRRVSAALLDSMFIEGDLGSMAERLRETWPDLVLIVVGTAEEQTKVAAQITSGVVYRFLHRPVSAPRVRLFVEAALRRHEVENVERTLEQARPDFSQLEAEKAAKSGRSGKTSGALIGIIGAVVIAAAGGAWFSLSTGKAPSNAVEPPAQLVSVPAEAPEAEPVAQAEPPASPVPQPEPEVSAPPPEPVAAAPAPTLKPASSPVPEQESVRDRLREPPKQVVQVPEEIAPRTPNAPPPPTFEQQLSEKLVQAESALQRGELASPPGRNAVDLFRGALELDPGNTLAKAGLIRVADRLLTASERAITAGNVEDARKMVAVAESLTPATARGAFVAMQIERERERAALTRAKDTDTQDKLEKGATYLRLANARLRSGALIEPSEDNARYYLEAARQIVPDDAGVEETSRLLQRQLLDRAAGAASAGNAAETERWLANADSIGAPRQEMTTIRRALQDTLIGARSTKMTTLAQSFTAALSANRLVQPANDNAKAHLLALINTDASSPAVASARQGLGNAFLAESRSAVARGDFTAAETWLNEARTIGFSGDPLTAASAEIAAARERVAQTGATVGASTLDRTEYVAPKFPLDARKRGVSGWVELEYTVREDGSTGDIVVTNSSPRRTFDNAAMTAVSHWRYKPVLGRDGKPIGQRAAVRIRFSDE